MSNDEVLRAQARYAHCEHYVNRTSVVRNPDYVKEFRDWADQWRDTQPLGSSGLCKGTEE